MSDLASIMGEMDGLLHAEAGEPVPAASVAAPSALSGPAPALPADCATLADEVSTLREVTGLSAYLLEAGHCRIATFERWFWVRCIDYARVLPPGAPRPSAAADALLQVRVLRCFYYYHAPTAATLLLSLLLLLPPRATPHALLTTTK